MTDRSTNDGAWTPSDLTSAALDATAGFSTAELRALASRGGLAALLEAARPFARLDKGDFDAVLDGPIRDDMAAGYLAVDATIGDIRRLRDLVRALLPQTGEAEPEKPLPASVSDTDRVIADIAAERRRQVEVEGWSPEHDDSHQPGELARAGGCYAWCAFDRLHWRSAGLEPSAWPWDANWWKPQNPRRDLVRAGALILAEIERLDREALSKREDG